MKKLKEDLAEIIGNSTKEIKAYQCYDFKNNVLRTEPNKDALVETILKYELYDSLYRMFREEDAQFIMRNNNNLNITLRDELRCKIASFVKNKYGSIKATLEDKE